MKREDKVKIQKDNYTDFGCVKLQTVFHLSIHIP